MALILPSSSFTAIKPYFLHTNPHHKTPIFRIKSQQNSSTEETSSTKTPQNPSQASGFGASKKQQSKGKRERAKIIRLEPVEKPSFAAANEGARAEELRKNESAFLLAWLGLGAIILVQGIALAASGFLPESWDRLFAKYLYPSFTPTVFLFVAGTTAYGVLKYLQNENSKGES